MELAIEFKERRLTRSSTRTRTCTPTPTLYPHLGLGLTLSHTPPQERMEEEEGLDGLDDGDFSA